MNKINDENSVMLETIMNIFTVENKTLRILLTRRNKEPYKGYWCLPNKILKTNETIENTKDEILEETVGTKEIYTEQNYTFSKIDRNPNNRILATSYIALIDSKTVEIKRQDNNDYCWFGINELPKLAFDHKEIIEKATELLKNKLVNVDILKRLFPSDFTLPELQGIYELIMNKKIDRRNFRKKFINLGLIEDTGYKNEGKSGRPAKLYRFKENTKEANIF